MRKHIIICGSPGSGKTLFSAALAATIAKEQKRVLLISPNYFIPVLPQFGEKKHGLGRLFSEEVTLPRFTQAVMIVRENPLIGILGYGVQEQADNIRELDVFSSIAEELADVVIWDLSADVTDPFYRFLMEQDWLRVGILTTDIRGLFYYREHLQKLSKEILFLAGQVKPYSPYEEISEKIGGFSGMLPFSRDLEIACLERRMTEVCKYCHKKYLDTVLRVYEKMEGS